MPRTPKFQTIAAAVKAIKRGKPIVVVDDANRENEGDVQFAASLVTPALVNFMIKEARGLVCVALPHERLQALHLAPMVADNTDPFKTDFTVSVNARFGVTTGISAYDRAQTIKTLIDPKTKPIDLVRPGHVFPLRARAGGVLTRAGHTEAAVDFAALAGLAPAGVTCEIVDRSGKMARLPQLAQFARTHKLPLVTIADLIAYRRKHERCVRQLATASIPTEFGTWQMAVFQSPADDKLHVALVKGDVVGKSNVWVRVHSECFTGDIFGSKRCDCGEQLHAAMRQINEHGSGVILYMRQEGRGIGLVNKLNAYVLQDAGLDTVEANLRLGFPADLREYGVGAQILHALGLSTIQLLTNNPKKIVGLEGFGLRVTKQRPLQTKVNAYNRQYLQTKQKKLGHTLDVK